MWDDGEEDDVDWESLVAKSIAAYQSMQPDEAMEREEQEAATRRLMWYLERSEDRATQLIRRRYIEGASYEQMAAEEHATCSNMRTRISRATRAVRQTLIDVYEGKSPQNLCRSSQNHGHTWRRFCRCKRGNVQVSNLSMLPRLIVTWRKTLASGEVGPIGLASEIRFINE